MSKSRSDCPLNHCVSNCDTLSAMPHRIPTLITDISYTEFPWKHHTFSCYCDWQSVCMKLLRAMVPNTNGSKLRSAFQICPNKIHMKSATSVGAPCVSVCSATVLCDFRVTQIAWHSIFSICLNLLNPTGHVMHQQFNIQQLYALPTLYLCVSYLSENKQRLVPLTA